MGQAGGTVPWQSSPYHRTWLLRQARRILDLFQAGAVNPRGGFFELDDDGAPLKDPEGSNTRVLHVTTRMIYCFALGHHLGHPGSAAMVDHGMAYLSSGHRDPEHGGFVWSAADGGPVDDTKQAYGHAFVLLAAASAKTLGHPDADRLLAEVTDLLVNRFWEEQHGAVAEEFSRDWAPLGPYRGQNSNMHLTEALMAAFEVTGDPRYLAMAERIADLLIRRITAAHAWRLPEHFDPAWRVDHAYVGSEMFRPAGTTPGHWLEWSRLLVQLWTLGGKRHDWMTEAAAALFRNAVGEGWDAGHGGFFYTLDFEGRPLNTDKIWWPVTEGIGAAATIGAHSDDPFYEEWYRRLWDFAAAQFIDPRNGGWRPQRDATLALKSTLFVGKPDIYHSLQATLIPLVPAEGGLLAILGTGKAETLA